MCEYVSDWLMTYDYWGGQPPPNPPFSTPLYPKPAGQFPFRSDPAGQFPLLSEPAGQRARAGAQRFGP